MTRNDATIENKEFFLKKLQDDLIEITGLLQAVADNHSIIQGIKIEVFCGKAIATISMGNIVLSGENIF